MDETDALAAAARRRLEHDGIADLSGEPGSLARILQAGVVARHDRHARAAGDAPRRRLLAHLAHHARRRANEDEPASAAGVGEVGVLREEAVAGMDRARAGPPAPRRGFWRMFR